MNVSAFFCAVLAGFFLVSGCVQDFSPLPQPAPEETPEPFLDIILSPPDRTEPRLVPGGTYQAGDRILISGITNLAPGNEVLIEVYSRSFGPTDKRDGDGFSGASGVIIVEEGISSGENILQYELDTTGFAPGEYQVLFSGITVPAVWKSATFTLLPGG